MRNLRAKAVPTLSCSATSSECELSSRCAACTLLIEHHPKACTHRERCNRPNGQIDLRPVTVSTRPSRPLNSLPPFHVSQAVEKQPAGARRECLARDSDTQVFESSWPNTSIAGSDEQPSTKLFAASVSLRLRRTALNCRDPKTRKRVVPLNANQGARIRIHMA